MSTILALAPSVAALTVPAAAYVALAGIYFRHGSDWLELGESTFLEAGLSSTITLLDPLTPAPTRAAIGSLRQGTYYREGRTLSREQLLSELEACPVAFRAQVEYSAQVLAWMVQLQD